MKKIDIGQIIGILANIGVIAGIIFLGVELRQNNDLLAAQSRRDQLAARASASLIELNNADIAELTFKAGNGDELTDFEYHRFSRWARYLIGNWEAQFDEFEAGLLAESELPVAGWASRFESLPQLRRVWEETREVRSPRFIRFVDENVLGLATQP